MAVCIYFLIKSSRSSRHVLADWRHKSQNIGIMAPLGHGRGAHRRDRRARELAPHSLTQVSLPSRAPSRYTASGDHPGARALAGTLGELQRTLGERGGSGIWGQRRAPWHCLRACDTLQDRNSPRSCPEDLHYAKANSPRRNKSRAGGWRCPWSLCPLASPSPTSRPPARVCVLPRARCAQRSRGELPPAAASARRRWCHIPRGRRWSQRAACSAPASPRPALQQPSGSPDPQVLFLPDSGFHSLFFSALREESSSDLLQAVAAMASPPRHPPSPLHRPGEASGLWEFDVRNQKRGTHPWILQQWAWGTKAPTPPGKPPGSP